MEKHYILSEVKRTADENMGIPLGREKFYQSTGIKESDWSGIYWARWGDIIQEAGYTPNKLQKPHLEEHLLEQYILLVRYLGRIPTAPELRLQRRKNLSFPSHNTFGRFGSKNQLIQKVINFCSSQGNFDDVLEILKGKVFDENEEAEKVNQPELNGFVYLIQSGRFYKIGKTNAVGRRERELTIQLPEKIITIHTIRTDDPTGIERYWHHRFKAQRKNGEWFELSRADVAAFRRRRFM